MRKRLLYLVFGLLVVLFGPAGAALANGGHESEHGHDHDHEHEGDQCPGEDHHEGDRSYSRFSGHQGSHHDGHGDGDHEGDHEGDHGDDHEGDHVCKSSCPCVAALPLFASVVNGQVTVADCVATTTTTSVVTSVGTFVITNSGATPPYCSVGGSPPFISITAAQATLCSTLLQQASAKQNVVCHPPE